MAIFLAGKTECSLCRGILTELDDVVMFPHFIEDSADPLWRFSDSAMHRACFADWGDAEQFRTIHNEVWPKITPNHPRAMLSDGSIVEL